MAESKSYLSGKHILVVDDEPDILETIEDVLDDARLDLVRDHETAAARIKSGSYDLAILDIMGVDGLALLEQTVARGIPTVMLTAHAINPETLMESIRKGAISYLPKETLSDLDRLLNQLLAAYETGQPPWKLLFEKMGDYFDNRFGAGWKDQQRGFWTDFERSYQIGKGIQERLKHHASVIGKGI